MTGKIIRVRNGELTWLLMILLLTLVIVAGMSIPEWDPQGANYLRGCPKSPFVTLSKGEGSGGRGTGRYCQADVDSSTSLRMTIWGDGEWRRDGVWVAAAPRTWGPERRCGSVGSVLGAGMTGEGWCPVGASDGVSMVAAPFPWVPDRVQNDG